MNNADLKYRPLLGGVSILNARIQEPGTLGYFGRDATGSIWIISAYHVLCNVDLSPNALQEVIYQPAAAVVDYQMASTRVSKANAVLDCAAALLMPGIAFSNAQLGLGAVSAPIAPVVGMRVCKSGAVSGITEGIITQINDDTLRIEADPAFDPDYLLSDAGDSGSLWLQQGTLAPVALHRGRSSPRRADALNIQTALAALSLTPL
jgi:hypothetical protein